ncbi:hypothetical protein [Corynebacterium coyleae]|uniref:hypothetical protein n=1 Tax=Corynebacterium coyleae TaxID=53374 RepID=UPI002549EACC|nr:hypothetical protein [Corynebacterium coyleae]MDK8242135.1 hypothetical protein [Corynebacterium coyleae]
MTLLINVGIWIGVIAVIMLGFVALEVAASYLPDDIVAFGAPVVTLGILLGLLTTIYA